MNICYQAHVSDKIGWQSTVRNGSIAGTIGEKKSIEAIKIWLEDTPGISVKYRVYMKDLEWGEWKIDKAVAGTTDEGRRVEAIEIVLVGASPNLGVVYEAHVEYGVNHKKC